MPSKKKKFNARFPPARIKKIMQTDEEVGKVAAPVPVIISRALELFIESLILKSSNITKSRHAKTLSTSHIKQTILSEKRFDFLKDLVSNVADVQADEENTENVAVSSRNADSESGHKARGRPRKKKADDKLAIKRQVKRQKKLDDDPDTEETDTATEELVTDEDEDDEDEDDDEDTETDPDTQDSASISATSGRLNTYPQSEASCSTKETVTQSHLEQQTQSLDLRINQNKQSSPDQVENKLCTESEDAASLAVTCHRYTQPMQYTRLPLISTQPGAVAFRLGASTVVKAEQDTQSTPPPNTQCVDNSKCKQAAEKTGPGDAQSVRQATDGDENKNDGQTTDVAENRDRSLGSRADESIPCTSTAVSARSGMEPTSSRDSFPMYAGMPPVSMAFYPHHLGVMQQVNPYPAHMRPVPDGMSPYPPGMMPYQAMAFPGHAVLPHFTPLPAMMDSRFEMPRMNSVTTGVQGGFTESPPSGQPPPAHVKQSQQVTPLRQDKSERPTS